MGGSEDRRSNSGVGLRVGRLFLVELQVTEFILDASLGLACLDQLWLMEVGYMRYKSGLGWPV